MRPELSYVVVSTAHVVPPARVHRAPFCEIVLAADQSPDARCYVFATRDPKIIDRALAAEGYDTRFSITAGGVLEGLRREYRVLRSLVPLTARRRAS
jgi:hypothetical protein